MLCVNMLWFSWNEEGIRGGHWHIRVFFSERNYGGPNVIESNRRHCHSCVSRSFYVVFSFFDYLRFCCGGGRAALHGFGGVLGTGKCLSFLRKEKMFNVFLLSLSRSRSLFLLVARAQVCMGKCVAPWLFFLLLLLLLCWWFVVCPDPPIILLI